MGASLFEFARNFSPAHYWLLSAFVVTVAATGFLAAFGNLRRARILEDVPTSRVRSATQGYVELQGRGVLLDGPPIRSPLTQTTCTWWWYRVEMLTGDRRRRWKTQSEATSDGLFALQDSTGRCIIDPDGAEVYPMMTTRWRGHTAQPASTAVPSRRRFGGGRYRYTEKRMHAGDPLYVIGQFQTRYMTDNYETEQEVTELLRCWKRDRPALLARFDKDGDGEIDLHEWELARNAARVEIQKERRQLAANPGLSFLSAPPDGRPFLLGALPQPHLARLLRRKATAGLVIFAVSGAALAWLTVSRFG